MQRAAQTAVAQAMTGSAAVQSSNTNRRQVIPIAAAPPKNNMPVPIFKRSFSNLSGDSSAAPVNRAQSGKSSPVPPNFVSNSSSSVAASSTSGSSTSANEKKLQKRAANRRSAQLSRKRKKLFIEELREENDRLKRKEQILRAIPDLVVVFDSAGRLLFVSQAVRRVLDFAPTELEGSSFWDRLCEESVKLLKAAFMDALAARGSTDKKRRINAIENVEADGEDAAEVEAETVQLGSGMWELRLVDKNGAHRLVTLSGVVHFSGDSNNPECVCSIRPRETVQSSVRRVRPTRVEPPPKASGLATAIRLLLPLPMSSIHRQLLQMMVLPMVVLPPQALMCHPNLNRSELRSNPSRVSWAMRRVVKGKLPLPLLRTTRSPSVVCPGSVMVTMIPF